MGQSWKNTLWNDSIKNIVIAGIILTIISYFGASLWATLEGIKIVDVYSQTFDFFKSDYFVSLVPFWVVFLIFISIIHLMLDKTKYQKARWVLRVFRIILSLLLLLAIYIRLSAPPDPKTPTFKETIENLVQNLAKHECNEDSYQYLISLFTQDAKMIKVTGKISVENPFETVLLGFCRSRNEIKFRILDIEKNQEQISKIVYE